MKGPKIADSILDLIGRTPMVRLNRLAAESNVVANIVLKLESMEPCSSVKDRLAKALIEGTLLYSFSKYRNRIKIMFLFYITLLLKVPKRGVR